jgi:hypothetical protein
MTAARAACMTRLARRRSSNRRNDEITNAPQAVVSAPSLEYRWRRCAGAAALRNRVAQREGIDRAPEGSLFPRRAQHPGQGSRRMRDVSLRRKTAWT